LDALLTRLEIFIRNLEAIGENSHAAKTILNTGMSKLKKYHSSEETLSDIREFYTDLNDLGEKLRDTYLIKIMNASPSEEACSICSKNWLKKGKKIDGQKVVGCLFCGYEIPASQFQRQVTATAKPENKFELVTAKLPWMVTRKSERTKDGSRSQDGGNPSLLLTPDKQQAWRFESQGSATPSTSLSISSDPHGSRSPVSPPEEEEDGILPPTGSMPSDYHHFTDFESSDGTDNRKLGQQHVLPEEGYHSDCSSIHGSLDYLGT